MKGARQARTAAADKKARSLPIKRRADSPVQVRKRLRQAHANLCAPHIRTPSQSPGESVNIYVPAGLLAYSHGFPSAFPGPFRRPSGTKDEKRLITAAGPRGMYAPLPFSPTKSGHRNVPSTHGKVLPYSVRTAPCTSFHRVESVGVDVSPALSARCRGFCARQKNTLSRLR